MKTLLTLLIFFLAPLTACAATLSLSATPAAIGVGDVVEITISVTSDIPVNTFAGSLVYSRNLTPLSVSDGSSIISVWLAHPTVSSPISFSGFTPGGYVGRNGKLFSMLFRVTSAGTASISVADTSILRNDGAGSAEPVKVAPLALSILKVPQGGYVTPEDTDPPEPFVLAIGTSSQPFDGQSYLVFSAVDKNSGIDHYEVAESRLPWFLPLVWNDTGSPYLVNDQSGVSDIFIKAVDRAHNERITVFHRTHLLRPYEWVVLAMIMGVLCILYYMYMRDRAPFSLR